MLIQTHATPRTANLALFKSEYLLAVYRKIPKISPRAYIFQRPFLRGIYSEGFIYGGKFAFQNRLGYPYSWKEICRFRFVLICI